MGRIKTLVNTLIDVVQQVLIVIEVASKVLAAIHSGVTAFLEGLKIDER